MTTDSQSNQITRRRFLTYQAVLDGAPIFLAVEAVATTLMEHPEVDPEETDTWEGWCARQQ